MTRVFCPVLTSRSLTCSFRHTLRHSVYIRGLYRPMTIEGLPLKGFSKIVFNPYSLSLRQWVETGIQIKRLMGSIRSERWWLLADMVGSRLNCGYQSVLTDVWRVRQNEHSGIFGNFLSHNALFGLLFSLNNLSNFVFLWYVCVMLFLFSVLFYSFFN